MVVAKLISGLGNQLFQYAIARQLSLQLDVPLKLDISFFSSQNLRAYKLDYYNIHASTAKSQEIKRLTQPFYNTFIPGRFRGNVNRWLSGKHGYFKEGMTWVYDAGVYNRKKNSYIDGYWQNHKYFIDLHPIIKDELTLKPIHFEKIKSFAFQINSTNSVSIHIRRGDYITNKDAASLMGVLPISYYAQAIKIIKQRIENPFFYFFTDDLDWLKNYSGLIQPNSQVVEGYNDYEDLALMSFCKNNIIANSSFSWWGAFLNRNSDKIVIAPKQWVLPDEINSKIEIQMPSWILL